MKIYNVKRFTPYVTPNQTIKQSTSFLLTKENKIFLTSLGLRIKDQ